MAWYNSGNWEGVEVEKCATLLSQILYAINERQAAQGVTVTSWDSPVSTTYPTASNCVMAFSDCLNLLGDAQTAITNLCTTKNPGNVRFVESDYTTQYTLSNLLGDGSYGTSWLSLDRAQNARIWLQIREALDLLVYIKGGRSTMPSTTYYKYGDDTTHALAWSESISASEAVWGGNGVGPVAAYSGGLFTVSNYTRWDLSPNWYVQTGAIVGSYTIGFDTNGSYTGAGSSGSISMTDSEGNTWDHPLTSTSVSKSINLSSDTYSLTYSPPTPSPFTGITTSSDSCYRTWINITFPSQVTKQLIPGTHLAYG